MFAAEQFLSLNLLVNKKLSKTNKMNNGAANKKRRTKSSFI